MVAEHSKCYCVLSVQNKSICFTGQNIPALVAGALLQEAVNALQFISKDEENCSSFKALSYSDDSLSPSSEGQDGEGHAWV